MEFQNWENISWNKPSQIISKKKPTITKNKLNNFDEIQKIKKVSPKISQQIIQGRNYKKYTRKQLAKLCNLQENIITSYENSTAILNSNILNKIQNILGIIIKK